MTPEQLTRALRTLADQLDRDKSPSRSAVASHLVRMAFSVQGVPIGPAASMSRGIGPACVEVDVSDNHAFRRAMAELTGTSR